MKTQTKLPYAVVTGRVFPLDKGKILETISGMPAVISKLNTKEFRWVDTFTSSFTTKLELDGNMTPALNFVPFALSNPNNATSGKSPKQETYVMVDDVSNGEFDNLLLTAKATYIPTEITITGLMLSFIRGFHSVGIETSESVLPVGSVITVVGEVTKLSGGDGQGFRIAKSSAGGLTTPYILTTKSIMEVKSTVRAQATAFKVLTILFGCFTLMTFYALGKKWLPRFRLRRVRRVVTQQRERIRRNIDGLHEAQICLACLSNPREVVLLPCGHVCVCADCSLLIQERCPVCREPVIDTQVVFLA